MTIPIPTVTIYVRHSAGCKYGGDEFAKKCNCRKWLRWTPKGSPRQRRPAETRSWAEAELVRDDVRAELSGTSPTPIAPGTKNLRAAIEVFVADKKVENLSTDVVKKYERELSRLASFCEGRRVFTLAGIDRELITALLQELE